MTENNAAGSRPLKPIPHKLGPYIDERMTDMLRAVLDRYDPVVSRSADKTIAIRPVGKKLFISLPVDKHQPVEAFTIQLLRVYLHIKGIRIDEQLQQLSSRYSGYQYLRKIYWTVIQEVGINLLDVKAKPLFLEMGFPGSAYTPFHRTVSLPKEMEKVGSRFATADLILRYGTGQYLKLFFGMHSCPDEARSYLEQLDRLQLLSPGLYTILDEFWKGWLSFDISQPLSAVHHYEPLTIEFVDRLNKWMECPL